MTASADAIAAVRRVLPELRSGASPRDSETEHRIAARVVWSHLVEPGDAVAARLIAELGADEALHALERHAQITTSEVSAKEFADGRRRWIPRLSGGPVAASSEVAARSGARLVVPGDADWPGQLEDLGPHAPVVLWVRGRVDVFDTPAPSVAIVGARAATSYGEHVAMELAADLAGSGIPIVSGAAYGIDGSAHRAAIATGGTTVALLAGGVDRPYPAGHGQLIDRIIAAGAVASEVPCGSAPTKWRFLQRNRVIAALSDVTVVVEAGWRSGSLNTASHALALGRPVGAIPGPITSAASAGTHRLLRQGATCVTSGDDVRELLSPGLITGRVSTAGDQRPPTDDRSRVRDALSTRSWRDPDELARRSGMATNEVEGILGLLMIGGEVESGYLGWRLVSSDG